MEKKLRVGVLGATGMVGQRFISLLENHPWYEVVTVAASPRSAGKTYEEAVGGRWKMDTPMPEGVKKLVVMNVNEVEKVASSVDFVFSAVDMTKDEIRAIEEAYAKTETPVVSNNSAHRWTPDVPMVVPEINPEHFKVIEFQKKRLGTKRGFIAVKPNCSIQSYAPVLNGHTAAVFVKFRKNPTKEQLSEKLVNFSGLPQELKLPSAPAQFIQYLEEDNRPQVSLDVNFEHGMGISVGRLREDSVYDWKFVGLSHNTVRGAAGGAVLCAELLTAQGYISAK